MPNPKEKQVVVLKKLFCYIRNYTPLVILSLLFAAASAALALYVPILTGRAIDCILGPRNVDFAGIFHILFQMGLEGSKQLMARPLLFHENCKDTALQHSQPL